MNTLFSKKKAQWMFRVLTVLIIMFSSFSSTVYAQSAENDSLYAQGVKLYQSGKFKEAIPFFAQCDSLDQIELDSLDARLGNSRMWLASSYFKSGDDINGATKSSSYMLKPVDRRKTIKSDAVITQALKAQQKGNLNQAIKLMIQAENMEEQILGKESHWVGNTMNGIADCLLQLGDTVQATTYLTQALENSFITRGAVMFSSSWYRTYRLLELYSAQCKSGFYTLIQDMLLRAKNRTEQAMKHDLEMETAYIDWKNNTHDTDVCKKRMLQALVDCECIHGASSQHFTYMTSAMTYFLCATGDFETALKCNDRAFEHFNRGGSMMHFAYQTLNRDRMVILLGLGRVKEACKIGYTILNKCSYHNKYSLFENYYSLNLFKDQQLAKSDLDKLREFSPTLISHPIPVICPTDQDLLRAPSPLGIYHNQHICILFSVLDAIHLLTRLDNDTISEQATEIALSYNENFNRVVEERYEMHPVFDEFILRLFELVENDKEKNKIQNFKEKRVLNERQSMFRSINSKTGETQHKPYINTDGDFMLHFAIALSEDNLEVNALPFYNEYVRQKQLLFNKPLDQLTPKEQSLRRRFLIVEQKYAKEIKRFEDLRRKYF